MEEYFETNGKKKPPTIMETIMENLVKDIEGIHYANPNHQDRLSNVFLYRLFERFEKTERRHAFLYIPRSPDLISIEPIMKATTNLQEILYEQKNNLKSS